MELFLKNLQIFEARIFVLLLTRVPLRVLDGDKNEMEDQAVSLSETIWTKHAGFWLQVERSNYRESQLVKLVKDGIEKLRKILLEHFPDTVPRFE